MRFHILVITTFLLCSPSHASSEWNRIRDTAMTLREQGRPVEAYNLVARYEASTPEDRVDADFISGFLALRSLGKPSIAIEHFKNMAINTTKIRSFLQPEAKSTAGYYLARSLYTIGKHEESKKLYEASALYRDTFYGLLSAQIIGAKDTQKHIATVASKYPMLDIKYYDSRTNPALIMAIIQQESDFKNSTVSSAGAMGLMQLMPENIHEAMRKTGVSANVRELAFNPTYNIAIGSNHFGDMLSRFGNNIMLASAGYNAGEGRVYEWLQRFGDPRVPNSIDPIDWIELIPFKETRGYVKRIVAKYITYSTLYSMTSK